MCPSEWGPGDRDTGVSPAMGEGRGEAAGGALVGCAHHLVLRALEEIFFELHLCAASTLGEQPRLGWLVLLVPIRQVKFHKSLFFFFQLGVFCYFNIFNFINICRKDAGISYFLLERHVHLPSFPFNLPVPLTYLLLNSAGISACCDRSPALHGTRTSFNSSFSTAVSCKIRRLCLGGKG